MHANDPGSFEWDPQLETGYDKIDGQHQQLFSAVKNIMDASAGGKGDKVEMSTLDFLTIYVVKHFNDEEQLQRDYEYPDYLNHKEIHDDFKETVTELMELVNKTGPTGKIIDDVCAVVRTWLLNHIKGDDFRMAAFVKDADDKAMKIA